VSPTHRALRRLAREFRYRPLPALIGKGTTLDSSASVEGPIRTLLLAQGLGPGPIDREGALFTIAKCDLIDACFDAPREALDHPDTRTGLAPLKELGFLDDGGELGPADLGCPANLGCIDDLEAQLDDRHCLLKVFLCSAPLRDRRDPSVLRQMIRGELPSGYFPRRFVVRDACVTNVPTAWLLKHFYL
jgi:hypothetical protein